MKHPAYRSALLAIWALGGCGGSPSGQLAVPAEVAQVAQAAQAAPADVADVAVQQPVEQPPIETHLYVAATGSDTNPGTSEAPFRTILKASELATPGTTVHVAPGVYQAGFITAASGTASARIRYVSDIRWGAVLVPSAESPLTVAWRNLGDYVDVEAFEVDGSRGAGWRTGLSALGSYNRIANNHIHHIGNHAGCTSQGGSGINSNYLYYGTQNDIIGNVVHHIGLAGCRWIHGIYFATAGSVKNNVVYRIGDTAIHLWHDATEVVIANNTLFSSGRGILVGSGENYHRTGPVDNTRVSNNIVFDNDFGISEEGDIGIGNTFTDNLVYGNQTYDWSIRNPHTGSIAESPQFVLYDREGKGDYRLRAGSPAIGKGALDDLPATDIDGIARPQGGAGDIGAHEFR